MIRWATIILAVAGIALAISAVTPTFPTPPDLPPKRDPSVNPFPRGVAALGQIETADREARIAAPFPGLITAVHADVGDRVSTGDPLLTLDDRAVRAELIRVESGVAVRQAAIDRWHALPRPEDVPPLRAAADAARADVRAADAAVDAARAALASLESDAADRRDEFLRLGQAADAAAPRALSAARFSLEQADAAVARGRADLAAAQARAGRAQADAAKATADLDRALAGGWTPDLDLAKAELDQQLALVRALRLDLERTIVRAPRPGSILRRDAQPGQFAPGADHALLILGDLTRLHVRAQIDEEDIALVKPGAKALARTRGAVALTFDLDLVRIEPFARPKNFLSGSNTERVDTRVVEVVLAVRAAPNTPLYPGQAVDVYIDSAAPPPPDSP
ncbi:MAG: efflux RND transporter periplasmic adaptor subunit [Phycisphaeraceae bacterium]|nr:MAG: efflux RND transporter periplasmic adaptor subunit [Phycisphaeraceae bacterium]